MDSDRFDDMIRTLATRGISRRRTLTTLVASAVGGGLVGLSRRPAAAVRDLVNCCLYVCPDETDPDRQIRKRCVKPEQACPATFSSKCELFFRCPNLQTCDSCRLAGCI